MADLVHATTFIDRCQREATAGAQPTFLCMTGKGLIPTKIALNSYNGPAIQFERTAGSGNVLINFSVHH